MLRTQISLTEEQAARLRQIARAENVSIALLIRRSIDRFLEAPDPEVRHRHMLAAAGAGHSGIGDVAENHDLYLAETGGE
jgi:Ribbon-helix-helix protein, copG family